MIYWHSSCRSPKMSTHTRQVVCHCDPLKNWERNIIFYGWCHKKQNKTDLWVGISAFGKVLLKHYADAQFTLEGREEAEIEKKIMFKFFLSGLKIWIFISPISNPFKISDIVFSHLFQRSLCFTLCSSIWFISLKASVCTTSLTIFSISDR